MLYRQASETKEKITTHNKKVEFTNVNVGM